MRCWVCPQASLPPFPTQSHTSPCTAAFAGDSSARRCASVNAGAREVRVALLPHSHAKSFLRHSPLAKQQLAEMSWARQSENIVLEALLRLAMVKADLEAAAGRVGEGAVGASNVEEE